MAPLRAAMEPLWQPASTAAQATNLARFTAQAAAQTGKSFKSYADLHRWSVEQPGAFWELVWRFTDIIASKPASQPVRDLDHFPGARWFDDAELNFAENLLRFRDERPALVSILETGERRQLSYADVYRDTAQIATWLDARIKPGDRVAGWLPNIPEAVTAMLATTALGGVWSSCSPDFGANGALDRFGQIEPKVLFACDGYHYNGKVVSTIDKVLEVASRIPSIESIVWVSLLGTKPPVNGTSFTSLLQSHLEADDPDLTFVQRRFNEPLYVMYSSGTTGKPKCIVHGIGGTLIQHLKEHQLHTDLTRDDKLFFFTTCGWMMWNWLVSALATGCTLILYDGSPFHPKPDALLDMADREAVTIFGVSAKYLSALDKAGVNPRQSHKLTTVRNIISTGSPLTHEGFRYVYDEVKPGIHLASITGGTDIISCFVLGNPMLPVWEGELQCKGLGMAVDVWNDDGEPVMGEKGELVCTQSFPSCPIGFWNDPGNEKFIEAYFARWPGVWAHGDFAEITEHDGFIIHGRSDAVLNAGGVRIGTAEIYRQVEQIDSILESVCIAQDWEGDTRIVLFVVMQPGHTLDDALSEEIRRRLRINASPRHVPAKVVQVADIPRTMSGKIVELAVREVVHGRPVKNVSALANPETLNYFRDLAELSS
ncbi:MAG: acetoacetate--CoA ligase [Gammaproteobacteria bacterium]|nr:acetoacetate--CoA ligase [Gammaproteobacteria bacterium]